MNVHLTPEQEKLVREELARGHFRSVEEVIGEALSVLRGVGAEPVNGAPAAGDAAESQHAAVDEMLRYIEKNRIRLEGVSVKELIHEGHRL